MLLGLDGSGSTPTVESDIPDGSTVTDTRGAFFPGVTTRAPVFLFSRQVHPPVQRTLSLRVTQDGCLTLNTTVVATPFLILTVAGFAFTSSGTAGLITAMDAHVCAMGLPA